MRTNSTAKVNVLEYVAKTLYNSFPAMCSMYVRFKTIGALTEQRNGRINRLSKVNLILAVVSCIGLSLVGNFQVIKIPLWEFPTKTCTSKC